MGRITHQYHGETPNCSEWSYIAYIVPRWSEPIMTYAFEIPGRGFETTFVMNASHCPSIDETSSFVWLTIAEMREECPSVPMIIGAVEEWIVAVTFEILGVMPVTLSMSETKSEAARWTPWRSSDEVKIGVAFLFWTIGNEEADDLNETHDCWPIALTPRQNARTPNKTLKQGSRCILRVSSKLNPRMKETFCPYSSKLGLQRAWARRSRERQQTSGPPRGDLGDRIDSSESKVNDLLTSVPSTLILENISAGYNRRGAVRRADVEVYCSRSKPPADHDPHGQNGDSAGRTAARACIEMLPMVVQHPAMFFSA